MVVKSIKKMFEAQAALHLGRVAALSGEKKITFAELNRRGNQVAHVLRQYGGTAGDLVGVCMHRSPDLLAALLGAIKAGCAYLPLDPEYPAERLSYMIEDSGVRIVLTEAQGQSHIAPLPRRDGLKILEIGWPKSSVSEKNDADLDTAGSESELAYVIYTSGSTGNPKGVLGTHSGMLNRLHWMWERFPFEATEIGCFKTSINFLDSFCEIFGPLLQGLPVALAPEAVVKDVQALVGFLQMHQVTRLVVVPSLLRAMLDAPELAVRLHRLKLWVTSGEALSPELARRFRESLPFARLLNLYGSSEVSADCSYYEVNEGPPEMVSIGRPIANNQLYVLDENLQQTPVAEPGELYVGGAGLAWGYLRRPTLTAERFLPNPFGLAGSRMYRTGDLACWRTDGALEYLGRSDQQVKIRGFRVELGEIAATLQSHPSVAHAAVIARDIHSQKQIVAYVVPVSKMRVDREVFRRYLAERLPDYMLPNWIVPLDALPLNPSGKLDPSALPVPSPTTDGPGPQTSTEEVLARIFAEVLELKAVSIYDKFFDLGGDSISSMDLVSRARAAGLSITPVDIFRLQSVQALAAVAACNQQAGKIPSEEKAVSL